jgi:hypothetical protein
MSQQPNFHRGPRAGVAARPAAQSERTNGYGARCALCKVWVEPNQGRLIKSGGSWRVEHVQPCPNPGQTHTADLAASQPVDFKVPDGRYTIVWGDHYKTIRVRHQDEFDSFMPGKAVLSYLSGSNNDSDYTSFAHVDETGSVRIWKKHQGNEDLKQAVKVLLGDPKAASQAYARESGCCGVCNRSLTTPESIEAGIGPECSKKVAW